MVPGDKNDRQRTGFCPVTHSPACTCWQLSAVWVRSESLSDARYGALVDRSSVREDGASRMPARLVVLLSGSGTNLQALLEACDDPGYGAVVVAVGADRDGVVGLDRAEE